MLGFSIFNSKYILTLGIKDIWKCTAIIARYCEKYSNTYLRKMSWFENLVMPIKKDSILDWK
jgi:hypothetical protein